jgi:hypothetical protein
VRARVPGTRMEAWTPGGDLLVSDPGGGKIMELRPAAGGTAAVTTLLAGLTYPQGMAAHGITRNKPYSIYSLKRSNRPRFTIALRIGRRADFELQLGVYAERGESAAVV